MATLGERVAVLENTVKELATSHEKVSDKLDSLARRLLVGTCVLAGLIVGSKIVSTETVEQVKSLFGL